MVTKINLGKERVEQGPVVQHYNGHFTVRGSRSDINQNIRRI